MLSLHNTLTKKVTPFKPLTPGKVGLYVCGITPYDEPHVGHARCYVVFDVLRRVLEWQGYAVRHVQNFTDIDDKIIERANQKNESPFDLAERNIQCFQHWMKELNIVPAHSYPRVTKTIPIIVKLISRLVKAGVAYELEGNVYYSVRKFSPYGNLSGRKIDDLEAGARVDVDEKKKDPLDFALWKKAKEGEPSWESPWGPGRPGWHIECSAMSMNELGDTFDIHGGGQDLIFPHHENEIAQSNGATGNENGFAQCWVHNGFVTINKEKMSKSLGNFFTLSQVAEKFEPMVIRYFLLSQHYRSPLNFSDKELKVADTTWKNRIRAAYLLAESHASNGKSAKTELPKSFSAALLDDLNTPAALAELNGVCSEIFQLDKSNSKDSKAWASEFNTLKAMLDVLGFIHPQEDQWPQEVLDLVQQRQAARKSKDWKKSDEIRDQLQARGVSVEDTAAGPKLKKI